MGVVTFEAGVEGSATVETGAISSAVRKEGREEKIVLERGDCSSQDAPAGACSRGPPDASSSRIRLREVAVPSASSPWSVVAGTGTQEESSVLAGDDTAGAVETGSRRRLHGFVFQLAAYC
ncbi:hypothetical protein MTO96_004503 [Rhipicephalus appendiculatus]